MCSGCERELEWCAFCDESNCPQPICYRCVREHLGEWVEYPNAKVASPKPE
jgi:hypothetical protein